MDRSTLVGRSLAASLGLLALGATAGAQVTVTTRSTLLGVANDDRLGVSVAYVGDVDGDTRPDWMVGAPEDGFVFNLREGYAQLRSGPTGALIRQHDGTTNAESCGDAVACAGLVDADAVPDVIVASPYHGGSENGRVRVFSGANGALIWTFTGGVDEQLGRSVAGCVDVNNDGRDDIIVGVPNAAPNGPQSGLVRVYSGLTGASLMTINGTALGLRFGISVAGIGDLNGDNRDEFIVGSLNGATVLNGLNGTAFFPTFTTGSPDDVYGFRVCGVGDMSGDGVLDFAISGTQDGNLFNVGNGLAHVRSGVNGAILRTMNGTQVGDRFGSALAGGFDLNADGRVDLLVGADQGGGGPGFAQAFSGATGSTLLVVNGDEAGDRFGASVASLGDGDGDGKNEFAVGAPYGSPPASSLRGYARVFEADPAAGCPGPTNYCSLSPNSAGPGAQIAALGSTQISSNDLTLQTTGLPPSAIGIYFYGAQEDSTPFGNGLRCVTGPQVFRIGSSVAQAGVSTFPVNYAQLVQQPISAGETWKFQFWFRDVNGGGALFNLSNGLSATFCP
jgi:hypothetical protein